MIPKLPDIGLVEKAPLPCLKGRHVVLLGGSFDPVHEGHLAMARAAKAQLKADEVWFVPTHSTPLKERTLSEDAHRVRMLELATEQEPDFHVCQIELERPGKSYTVDTLEELTRRYPDHGFTWVIGADQLEQFGKWKDPEKLLRLARFACFARDGKLPKTKWKVQPLCMEPVDVSSTEIRRGEKLDLLDKKVLAYIYANRLYCRDFVKGRISPHRYLHSLSVASLAEDFAKFNGYDSQKAWLAGLFHDVAKNTTVPQMEPWMRRIAPYEMDTAYGIWHGFVGAAQVKEWYGIEDEEILDAIWHHVRGTSDKPLAMALYCADKLDPLRLYDSYEMIDLCKKDLKKGFAMVKEENAAYLRKNQ